MEVLSHDRDGVVAEVHRPESAPRAVAVLAHGAGGDRNAVILRVLAEELCARGLLVARIDLPYRQRRPKGPPSPSRATDDRAGIARACEVFAGDVRVPLIVGGHSYGGRQASMLVAESDHPIADALLLTSYPLHPPGRPERLRTDHLPSISVPTVVVHGRTDPFATSEELAAAVALLGGPARIVELDTVGHDLRPDKAPTASATADALDELVLGT